MNKIVKSLFATMLSAIAVVSMASCKNDAEIKVYTRDTSSGTREGFFEGIGYGEAKKDDTKLVKGAVPVSGNDTMMSSVKNDKYGIGYISLSSLADSGLKGLVFEGVEPTEANVINKSYKLTRNFNYCLRETYTDTNVENIVHAFVAYMDTLEGNATIKTHGGIIENAATKSWNDVKDNYKVAQNDNSNVTIRVGGSTSVKGIVSALLTEFSGKCGGFKFEHNATGSGDAYKRTNGSDKDGANACDLAFASREFDNTTEPMADTLKGKMCIDAIVAVVNKSNKLNSVTAANLKDIYSGTITKWSELE